MLSHIVDDVRRYGVLDSTLREIFLGMRVSSNDDTAAQLKIARLYEIHSINRSM